MKTKKFRLECDCGCEIVNVIDYEDDSIGIEFLVSSFYEKQNGVFDVVWHRLKSAWFMLSGKEFYLHDIIIEKEKLQEFKQFIGEL